MSGQNIEIVKLQVRRGPEAQLPVLDSGEPAITTDTNKFFIGDGTTNHQLANLDDLSNVNSQLAQIVSQNNNTVTYGYDANGNVQTVTEKDPSNNVVKTVTYTYNAAGDVATSVTVMNGKTTTTTYNYDANGNITSTSNVMS